TIASPHYASGTGSNPLYVARGAYFRPLIRPGPQRGWPSRPAARATAIIRASSSTLWDRGGTAVSDVAVEPVLLIEDIGPIRRLTMNRPDALNALNAELTRAISEAIREVGGDDAVSVVILRAAGRAFCAG